MFEHPPVDPRFFGLSGPHGVVEHRPAACPGGHPLGPDTVLIAAHPCGCTSTAHRIWRCWVCDRVWVRPPCRLHPEWAEWAGLV